MPLDKTTLANTIASAFATAQGLGSASQAQQSLASSIAGAIDTYVKGASVNVTAVATIIAPPGTAGGPCSGSASGSLS